MLTLLVKSVMDGVGISPVTFRFFVLLFRALMFHARTDACSSSLTRGPCGMGSLGWTTAKWASTLYNQTVVVHLGQFTGRLVQGSALVAIAIPLHEIADGFDGQELTATTISAHVDRDCNGKRIVHCPVPHKNHKCWRVTVPLVPQCGDHVGYVAQRVCATWAEMLSNPCILGGLQQRGQIQNWLHNFAFAK